MSDRANGPPSLPDGVPDDADANSVEAYQSDGATVLYDAENPLAWIESSRAVRIDEAA